MVIDFRNDGEKVQKSFQQYYTETTLNGEVDTQRVYTMKKDIEDWNIFNEQEIDAVVSSLHIRKNLSAVPSLFKKIIEDRVTPLEDDEKECIACCKDLKKMMLRLLKGTNTTITY